MAKQKKCKVCKTSFEPVYSSVQLVCSPKCAYEYARKQEEKKWKAKKKKIKEELLTVQDLTKIAQTHFNNYIRERDRDKGCVSCGVELKGKFDAGHFYSAGGHTALRFDERNTHAQCVACNQHKHGNLHEYRKRILTRINERSLQELDNLSQETRKFSREDLRGIINEYKLKLKQLRYEDRS